MTETAMRFLMDEDLPRSCGARLRQRGLEVVELREGEPRGLTDRAVLDRAAAEGLVLLTGQAGFGNLALFPPDVRPRLIVVETHGREVRTLGDAVLVAVGEAR